ncbi:glycosyltransferase [Oricola sp.]|uniref:glycosyltransferase n=1 Tax=Oricola sp. TaxID=1979950 RepID=UPI003BA89F07
MIPRIIHQTWHSPVYTGGHGSPESWREMNPGWEYRLWTDDDLDAFVADAFPNYLDLFRSYPNVVQRTDMARYMLLHRFGGVYADIDTDCLASLDVLSKESRVVFCEEPRAHWNHARIVGLDSLFFNGTLASPAGHPFWLYLLQMVRRCRHAAKKDVLASTGPLVLSASIASWPDQASLSLNSCHLFAPLESGAGKPSDEPEHGDYGACRLSRHNWASSWFTKVEETRYARLKGKWRKWRTRMLQPRHLSPDEAARRIDRDALLAPANAYSADNPPNVAICVPVRDAAPFIDRHLELINALDYPPDRVRLVYCEGDSVDDTLARLRVAKQTHGRHFRGFDVLSRPRGFRVGREKRWKQAYQLQRRASIAAARNAIIHETLNADDEWVLWLDIDVCDFTPDIIQHLLAVRRKIVMPNCVKEQGGSSYDLNAFRTIGEPSLSIYYKHMHGGLFQPPENYWFRRHLHDLRFLDLVPLDSVGATMLLVHGSVHRAGLDFPEIPYRDLIETEAFGRLASDLGLQPVGLPNTEIFHVDN